MFFCFGEGTLGRNKTSVQACLDCFLPYIWELTYSSPSCILRLLLSPSLLFLCWWVIMNFKLPLVFLQLGQWSTFGTLEVTAQTESKTKQYSVVTEENCEILKIPAKDYAKLKSVWLYLICILTHYGYKFKLSFASLGRRCPYLCYLICLDLETIKMWFIWL